MVDCPTAPPATWRGRSRPPSGGRRRRSARLSAMAGGGPAAFLGAVACLCFLAPAAEGFKKRGPSVTAKVTLARGSADREASPRPLA